MVRTTISQQNPQYRVYAATERPTSPDAPLYHAPLPNIYYDGNVCWGTVTKPGRQQLAGNDLSADWAQLLATPFGNHGVAHKCRSRPDDIRSLYLDLEKRRARVYPKRELLPLKRALKDVVGGQP